MSTTPCAQPGRLLPRHASCQGRGGGVSVWNDGCGDHIGPDPTEGGSAGHGPGGPVPGNPEHPSEISHENETDDDDDTVDEAPNFAENYDYSYLRDKRHEKRRRFCS